MYAKLIARAESAYITGEEVLWESGDFVKKRPTKEEYDKLVAEETHIATYGPIETSEGTEVDRGGWYPLTHFDVEFVDDS